MKITPEMMTALEESHKREREFFERHGQAKFFDEDRGPMATPARAAWVKAVELEYNKMGKDVRVHLDTPLARKAFCLGFLMAST